jgi:hypothetical protein
VHEKYSELGREKYVSRKGAKAQRRKGAKKTLKKRGSALRLCAFAGEIFFIEVLFVQSWVKP